MYFLHGEKSTLELNVQHYQLFLGGMFNLLVILFSPYSSPQRGYFYDTLYQLLLNVIAKQDAYFDIFKTSTYDSQYEVYLVMFNPNVSLYLVLNVVLFHR